LFVPAIILGMLYHREVHCSMEFKDETKREKKGYIYKQTGMHSEEIK
jgi:hypothetical protein